MAAQKLLHVNITKVDGSVFMGELLSVTVPGSEGEMTLLADHTPLVSALKAGTVTLRHADGTNELYVIESGTIEVSHNTATILI